MKSGQIKHFLMLVKKNVKTAIDIQHEIEMNYELYY